MLRKLLIANRGKIAVPGAAAPRGKRSGRGSTPGQAGKADESPNP
jgi:hypothetical protein